MMIIDWIQSVMEDDDRIEHWKVIAIGLDEDVGCGLVDGELAVLEG